jgi:four helix bundle protein
MSRDHRKLEVFALADRLVMDVYTVSGAFPAYERFGLQAQLRKAAVSTASNIVEGCARRTTREYLNFLSIASGSAAEAGYLTDVSKRLGFLSGSDGTRVQESYNELTARLNALINSLTAKGRRERPCWLPRSQSREY